MTFASVALLAQLVSTTAAEPAVSATPVAIPVAPITPEATPAPRPTLGPDRPGARFGSDPSVDLMDPKQAALEIGHRQLDAWETEKALKTYKKIVKKNDQFADGHFWVGVAADLSGDLPLACAELRRYLALAPTGYYVPAAKKRSAACPKPTPGPDWGTPTPAPAKAP